MSDKTPTFLIIGAARCGSTALCRFLGQHPDVFLSEPKEPHFMAFAGQQVAFRGPHDDKLINRLAITQHADYLRLFRKSRQSMRGEGSVSTLYYHESSIDNIKRYAPHAKLYVVLRNPIQRAHSSFLYMTARGYETTTSFQEALELEETRIAEGWHHIWHYVRMGLYAKQLAAFMNAFPPDQLSVISFDDLREHPQSVMHQIYRELGVDDSFVPRTDTPTNSSGEPRSRWVQSMINGVRHVSVVRDAVKSILSPDLRDRMRSWNLSKPEISPEVEDRLSMLFADDLLELSELTKRDFTQWLNVQRDCSLGSS